MTTLLATLIALATLAFGGVYFWGFVPLFGAAAVIGVAGLYRTGLHPALRTVAFALVVVCVAGTAQLVPMPTGMLALVSPATLPLVGTYDLAFAGATDWAPLSIRPQKTAVAVASMIALSLYLLGLPGLLWPRRLRALPGGLAIVAVPIALYGIFTREYNNGLIYGFWQPQDGGGGNQFGPFINRNHFGGWMVMTLGLLVGSLLGRIEGAVRDSRRPQFNSTWLSSSAANRLMLIAGVVVLGAVAIFWSLSRSSIVSFTALVAMFIWLASRRRRLGETRKRLAIISIGGALVAGLLWRGPDRVLAWFQDDRNLVSRVETWRDAWDVIRAFPLFGTGLNTFSEAMLFYQTRNPGFHMAQAHNDYVQLAAEGGLLVVLPAMAVAVSLGSAILRNLRAARPESRGYWIRVGASVGIVAVAIQETVEFSLQIPVNAFLFATLVAVALTPVVADNGGSRPRLRSAGGLSD